jgi:hypothetical protein
MARYDRGGEKLILCSGCSEIVPVDATYNGNLCESCRDVSPYDMHGDSSMKQTKKSLMPLGDYALIFRKMIVASDSIVRV